jgi:hypothetical protein
VPTSTLLSTSLELKGGVRGELELGGMSFVLLPGTRHATRLPLTQTMCRLSFSETDSHHTLPVPTLCFYPNFVEAPGYMHGYGPHKAISHDRHTDTRLHNRLCNCVMPVARPPARQSGSELGARSSLAGPILPSPVQLLESAGPALGQAPTDTRDDRETEPWSVPRLSYPGQRMKGPWRGVVACLVLSFTLACSPLWGLGCAFACCIGALVMGAVQRVAATIIMEQRVGAFVSESVVRIIW